MSATFGLQHCHILNAKVAALQFPSFCNSRLCFAWYYIPQEQIMKIIYMFSDIFQFVYT